MCIKKMIYDSNLMSDRMYANVITVWLPLSVIDYREFLLRQFPVMYSSDT